MERWRVWGQSYLTVKNGCFPLNHGHDTSHLILTLFVGQQASEEVSKSLQAMKEILCGTTDKEPPTEVVAQLAQELYNSGLLVTLIANLQLIDFEVGQCA